MSTRLTNQLAAPSAANYVEGRYAYHSIWRCEATVAKPVVPLEISELMSISIDPPAWDFTKDIFSQGSGNNRTRLKRGITISGTITCSKGNAITKLAQFFGLTMGSTNTNFIPGYIDNDNPSIIWEACCRDRDNVTHLYSVVIPDMIIDDMGYENPLENSDFSIKFHSYMPWGFLYGGREVVYDEFTGDGSTTEFTLSGTPVNLLTEANYSEYNYDTLFYVKTKVSGESAGTVQRSGWTQATTKVTATTAPAVATVVQVLYAKASA